MSKIDNKFSVSNLSNGVQENKVKLAKEITFYQLDENCNGYQVNNKYFYSFSCQKNFQ